MGACFGALAAAGWSGLDWMGRADATPAGMVVCVALGGVLGTVAGAALKLPVKALRASVDRRAGLDNRLTASAVDVPFVEEIRADAASRLRNVRPSEIYPLAVGRWHAGALASMALAASIFLLGSTPILLSPEAKATRDEMVKKGEVVERVLKEQFETPEAQKEMTDAERRLAEEARRLQRDLEKGRLNREEALQRANELQQKAMELAKQAVNESSKSLDQAETAMEQMERAALEKSGLGQVDPSLLQMPQGQREERKAKNAAKQESLKKQLEAIDRKLAELAKKLAQKGLSEQERKSLEAERQALEKQKAELQKQMEEARKESEALKLSDEAKQTLDKMRNHELMKEIRKLAEQLKQSNSRAEKTGRPKLTPEQRAEMKKKLEELLSKLKDDKAMEEYLKQMLEAMRNGMKQAGKGEKAGGLGLSLSALLGLKGGMPDVGEDGTFMDTGHVNKLDKPEEGKGKTFETQISGARKETGEESYVEIKAPTLVGNRTSVPYQSVLPSYKKKAEQALGRQEIPKEHEKRVRAYFESLTKGP
jgi:hypothetical protein